MTAADLRPWIAADLKQWRQRLGLTQARAADALGMERTAYWRMEQGRSRIDRRTELACRLLERERA